MNGLNAQEEFIEVLSVFQHDQWSMWMAYFFNTCNINSDGSLLIAPEQVMSWQRKMDTPFEELSELEKQGIRKKVLGLLGILGAMYSGADNVAH